MSKSASTSHSALRAAVVTAVAGALTLGLSAGVASAADKPAMEKCYGVAKAGKNDCQTASGSCAGTSKMDAQKDAWVFVPKGTCAKIVGGMTSGS